MRSWKPNGANAPSRPVSAAKRKQPGSPKAAAIAALGLPGCFLFAALTGLLGAFAPFGFQLLIPPSLNHDLQLGYPERTRPKHSTWLPRDNLCDLSALGLPLLQLLRVAPAL